MKRLLYAVLGLFLLGTPSFAQQQTQKAPKAEFEFGVSHRVGATAFPSKAGWSTSLGPIVADTTWTFYYDVPGKRIIRDFTAYIQSLINKSPGGGGGPGTVFTPGVGLNLSGGYLSVNQYPMAIGTPFVDGLRWRGFPESVLSSTIASNNSRFLFREGDKTLETSFNDIKKEISDYVIYNQIKNLDLGLGIKFVEEPEYQFSPGAIGEMSIKNGKLYVYGRASGQTLTQWFMKDGFVDVFNNGPSQQTGGPIVTGQYDQASTKIKLNWNINRTDVTGWDVFASPNDSLHYNLEASGLAAGLRDYDLQAYGDSVYYIKLRGRLPAAGSYTPFSKQLKVTLSTTNAYLPVINVVLTPLNGANAIKVDLTTQDAGGEVVLRISSNPSASNSSDAYWTSQASVNAPNAGQYSYTFTGINDQQARTIQVWRQGAPKTPSPKQIFGPVALTSVNEPVAAPTIASVTAGSNGTSAILNYVANNTGYTRLDIYRSGDGGNTFGAAINAGATATSYTDTGLEAGKTYVYKAQVLKNGTYSAFSATKSVTMPGTPTQQDGPTFTNYSFTANGSTSDGDNAFGYGNQFKYTYQPVQVYQSYVLDGDMRVNDGAWTDIARSFSASFNPATQKGYGAMGEIVAPAVAKSNNIVRLRIRFRQVTSSNGGTVTSPWSKNILKITYGPNYDTNNNDKKWELEAVSDQTPTGQVPPTAQNLQFTATSVTTSSITVQISNPNNSGTINYNWSIYKGDAYGSAPEYKCSKYDNPAQGTLTINTSQCPLVAGETYRLYVANSTGAKRESYVTFTQPGGSNPDPSGFTPGVIPSGITQGSPNQVLYMTTSSGARVGWNMSWGGAITEAYQVGSTENMVNNADYGRQWQYAYYGWPTENAVFNGKYPHPQWRTIGWDPIQAGDMSTPSKVLQYKFDEANKTLYYRTRPQLWGYYDVPCECTVDTWVKVNGKAVEVTNILRNARTDQFEANPRGQDIGGAYLNSYYKRWKSYIGNQPFTGGSVSDIDLTNADRYKVQVENDEFGTNRMYLSENWAWSYKPSTNEGLGLWSPSPYFSASVVGGVDQGANTNGGAATTLGTHMFQEHINRNSELRYDYAYIIGSAEDTRTYALSRRNDAYTSINFDFSKDHQHWWSNANYPAGQVSEYPFPGYWEVKYDQVWANFASADLVVPASKYTKMEIVVAVQGGPNSAAFNLWKKRDNGLRFNGSQYGDSFDDTVYNFNVINDGQFHTYTIDLTANPAYGGIISKMYLDFGGNTAPGRFVRIKSIRGLP